MRTHWLFFRCPWVSVVGCIIHDRPRIRSIPFFTRNNDGIRQVYPTHYQRLFKHHDSLAAHSPSLGSLSANPVSTAASRVKNA